MTDPTPSYAAGPTEQPLLEQTIGENLHRTVERFPDHEALVDVAAGRRWSYREFLHDVQSLATGLDRLGVRTGDRVGIWGPNSWEWVLTQYAAAEIGAVLVNINPAYRQHEVDFALAQAGISTVISSPAFKNSDYAGMLEAARPNAPELKNVVLMGTPEWDALFTEPDTSRLTQIAAGMHADDAVNIQYTSGTTGRPKGATLSHRNILNNGYFIGELLHYTAEDRIVVVPPLYHCFGMVIGNLAATSHGCAVILSGPGFDPRAALRAVAQEKATSLYGVPTMFIAELELPDFGDYDLSTLRTGVMAGSPCPMEVMRKVIDRMNMREVAICYGMTETSPVSFQTRSDDPLERRVGTVGRVHPHVEVKIVDPSTGETVPRGQAGEFCTRGYSVMKGYWGQEEKTREAIDPQGWLHTGDIAVMDEDGYAQITGRIKDMVIRGGENIYPREVEEFLYTHPDIVDAQVIGVPSERYGEELMVWLRLRDGAPTLTPEAILEFADGKISRHKIPRYVHVVEEFPMTVTGKVRKVEMREEALKLLDLENRRGG